MGIALEAVLSKEYVVLNDCSTKIIVYVGAPVYLMWHEGSRCMCHGPHQAFGQSIYVNVAVKYFAAYVLCLRTFAQ
jgi:hypothetical protein